jgi:hypothetical protein
MWSKGISWIDDCRIGTDGGTKRDGQSDKVTSTNPNVKPTQSLNRTGHKIIQLNIGRFPANLLVSDDALNDGVITKQSQRTYKPTDKSASLFGNSPQAHGTGIGDSGSSSRYYDIDKWFNNLIDV